MGLCGGGSDEGGGANLFCTAVFIKICVSLLPHMILVIFAAIELIPTLDQLTQVKQTNRIVKVKAADYVNTCKIGTLQALLLVGGAPFCL